MLSLAILTTLSLVVLATAIPNDEAFEQDILDEHNRYRLCGKVLPLRWNSDLAAGAEAHIQQIISEGCPRVYHSDLIPTRENIHGFRYVGENWHSTGNKDYSTHTAAGVVRPFYNEVSCYEYGKCCKSKKDTEECKNRGVGHFTQVMWSATWDLGCARNSCEGKGIMTFCWYGEGGNVQGQYPFKESSWAYMEADICYIDEINGESEEGETEEGEGEGETEEGEGEGETEEGEGEGEGETEEGEGEGEGETEEGEGEGEPEEGEPEGGEPEDGEPEDDVGEAEDGEPEDDVGEAEDREPEVGEPGDNEDSTSNAISLQTPAFALTSGLYMLLLYMLPM